MNTREVKTQAGWSAAKMGLSEYLKPGDLVDETLLDHILGAVPPVYQDSTLVQMGEAYDHRGPGYTARYLTVQKIGGEWTYMGLRGLRDRAK